MSTSTTTKDFRLSLGFKALSDSNLLLTGRSALTGLPTLGLTTAPPVDPAVVKTALDNFDVNMVDAVDGGRRAVTAKNKQRKVVIAMLRQLAIYVESNCDGDLALLTSSGFKVVNPNRNPNQPVAVPSIVKVSQGISGQLLLQIKSTRRAVSHEIHWAALAGTTPGVWITIPVVSLRSPAAVNGLTPGTTYAFQVRALGPLGYTEWSDSVTRMCI